MRKDSDFAIEISSGSPLPIVEPEVMERSHPIKPALIRDLGARADGIVVIDYGDERVIHYDRRPAMDDIHLARSAHAGHLRDY